MKEKTFYKLPLDMERFFTDDGNSRLELCDEPESIDRFLNLLITTGQGEHSFNTGFGARIWELDFENITDEGKWKERFAEYIRSAVVVNEKRISDVQVQIKVRDAVCEGSDVDAVTVRKQVDIYIVATIVSNNARCRFGYTIYLGPLSGD